MGDITVRVGQQNAIKVISSISGTGGAASTTYANSAGVANYANFAGVSTSVVGGVAAVSTLNVSGIATFAGSVTFNNGIHYQSGIYSGPNGVAFFDNNGLINSSPSTNSYQSLSGYILTTDNSNNPIWTDTIIGGTY
jgi:hypothetical protein